mmetsp:Transcript_107328/g.311838  ORF Transcript_107328/g.311838 Transcript_107328/m.311838 type:complete len:165 (+) Transcript_107328:239-733(+)
MAAASIAELMAVLVTLAPRPDTFHLSTAIATLGRTKKPDEALALFDAVSFKHAPAPNIVTLYSAAISACLSMGSAFAFSAGKESLGQVGSRRRDAAARAKVGKVLPGATICIAAAIVACTPGRARGATLPSTLPTSTTTIALSSQGYSGTIPTEFGQLTKVMAI